MQLAYSCNRMVVAALRHRSDGPLPQPPPPPPIACVSVIRRQKLRPYIDSTGQVKNVFVRCLLGEFFGTLLFQMFGGSAPSKDTTAPAANGFALVAVSECRHHRQYANAHAWHGMHA